MGRSVALLGGVLAVALVAVAACGDEAPAPVATPEAAASPSPAAAPPAAASPTPAAASPAPAAASPSPAAEVVAAEQPRSGGILKRTHPTDPAGFDPVQDASINTVFLIAPIYAQLLRYDPQGGEALTPELAESWQLTPDGRQLTFTLRDGVAWHDGEPFTSADVKAHFERVIDPPQGPVQQRAVALPPRRRHRRRRTRGTVRINTEFATESLLQSFAGGHYMVVSKHVMERETADDPRGLRKSPEALTGTGPFVFDSYEPGVAFRVRRNPDYWDAGKPHLDGIDFLIIRDPLTRFSALVTGRVHMSAQGSPSLTPAQAAEARRDHADDIVVERVRGPFWLGGLFNAARPPFDDPRVRQALSLAVDRSGYLQVVTGGPEGVGVLGGLSPPGAPFALPDEELRGLAGYRQPKAPDLDLAQRLLEQAGLADGFRTSVTVRGDVPLWVDAALFLQDQWQQLGLGRGGGDGGVRREHPEHAAGGSSTSASGATRSTLWTPPACSTRPSTARGPNFLHYPATTRSTRCWSPAPRAGPDPPPRPLPRGGAPAAGRGGAGRRRPLQHLPLRAIARRWAAGAPSTTCSTTSTAWTASGCASEGAHGDAGSHADT